MAIYLQNFSSIPLTKDRFYILDDEANFTGHDFGHKPKPQIVHYPPPSKRPLNIVATITNVIVRGWVIEEHWNDKRGPSPADEYFMKNGNR